jgi:2-polyprenyl-6-methoxyphenol hydroxylase-like FAD-dependent oxidoreductase
MLLYEAARERLGDKCFHFGRRITSHADVDADVIVAADGIHSAIRAEFYPNEGPPKWNRRVLWRGVTEADPYLGGATMVMAGHENQKFVCYPISPEAGARGGSLINWIAELRIDGEGEWQREDWNRRGDLADFLPRFENWNFGWLDVPAIIRGASQVFEYPMVDRDPVDRWTFGNVTLLGDAAHAMYPIGSNGASQAILDARQLAFELSRDDPAAALACYEKARRPPTTRIVLMNRGNGPEQVMQMVHERAPNGFAHVHEAISAEELQTVAANYKRAAGFDVEALNARSSLEPERPI